MYEDEAARRQIQLQNAGYGQGMAVQLHNPFDQHPQHLQPQPDPFAMSSNIAAPTNVQMALMAQQQQQLWQQQQQQQHNTTMMVPYDPVMQYSQQHHQQSQDMPQAGGSSNPFGDPFPSFPQHSMQQQEKHRLL